VVLRGVAQSEGMHMAHHNIEKPGFDIGSVPSIVKYLFITKNTARWPTVETREACAALALEL
jgi:hypothetical protein